ncbi:DUF1801 domain-containing protein [Portibacter lacus]|uniref:YdhG-like domain-containing protein n=1 Tax=Portibacter lacus TaxID=1099794 RepID=A0AA37WF77_9BACT|nr:DUF1801 domain-containing protein [Portibacter lacus]GLR17504.1 hypothetical protein GCM10007940_21190 [Portibacter lacus]
MKANPQLKTFLKPYNKKIQNLTLALRDFMTELIPEANELIWDNYNAVAIAYAKSEKLKDAFCHIAVYSKHVNFGFNRGAELKNPPLKLEGKGKLIRHIKITDLETFPKSALEKMILEAVAISDSRNEHLIAEQGKPKSLVMSISPKKIRPQ